LWFLGRNRADQKESTLETGNVISFVRALEVVIPAMNEVLEPGGRIVLVCGQAKVTFEGKEHSVRVSDLCFHALNSLGEKKALSVETVIMDRKLMTRGSYFAVHHGHANGRSGPKLPRYGEDEILVLRKAGR
jgi:hypothetical protein